ncbi:hypothetical protein KDL01_06015 [Actinospica durhamensis]|uniref:Clp R domain-containing protein n=1 Tax=Actinospica durhamensis TaxID=1508375 RepID=A0A941ELM4_9ACTN|nr:Clp protease N-terminal domain-containing protein [Actinospica durhamensis]MBR7832807.1 hypothetical protein [Actinospica durhamensis]
MFERFTHSARRVLVLAQEEARLLRHPVIDSAHLLLGLLAESEGIAALALGRCGVTRDAVRRQVLEIDGPGSTDPTGHIPFTVGAKTVLTYAFEDSLTRGVAYISTESLLLGLLREDCAGSRILDATVPGGVDQVRGETMALIRQRAGTPEEAQEAMSTSMTHARSGGAPLPPRSSARLRGFLRRRDGESVPEELRGLIRTPRRPDDPVVPRPELTGPLLAALGRRERNNALVIGPSGAGKSALVRWARQTVEVRGLRPGTAGHATLIELRPSALRLGPGRLIQPHRHLVVVVEDLDALFAAFAAVGVAGLAATLSELADSDTPLILTGTADANARLAEEAPALAERFTLIPVPAADAVLSAEILRVLRPELDRHHGVAIADETLAAAIELGGLRAAADGARVLPGAAVDLLDEAAARVALTATVPPAPAVRPEDLRAEPEVS